MDNMIALWKLAGEHREWQMPADISSLDAVTRDLPAGFYSTFRTYAGRTRVLGLASHLERLYAPAAALRIRPSVTPGELCGHLAALLADFREGEARIRAMISTKDSSGLIHLALEPLRPLSPAVYEQGVNVITVHLHRADPALKSSSFIEDSQKERAKVLKRAAFEGLIVQNARILEGLTSNFFYILGKKLGTERRGVLDGVTSRQVMALAPDCGLTMIFRALRLAEIRTIEEAFLTSSSRGIVPIVTIDERKVGSGGVGERTRCLMQAYEAAIDKEAEPILQPAL
jgi:branched-subunit amino acid aminotransferase/4-amino-4-deoxychorismate lyase